MHERRRGSLRGYLAKYVSKSFGTDRVPGLHRYEVAQGFQPVSVEYLGAFAGPGDRAGLGTPGRRAAQGLAVVEHGGVEWAASLLGAVGLTARS